MHSSICLSQSAKIVKYTGHSWFAKVNVYIFLIFSGGDSTVLIKYSIPFYIANDDVDLILMSIFTENWTPVSTERQAS